MKTLAFGLVLVFVGVMFVSDTEGGFATCRCSGCRPSIFHCNYNTFGGCNCASCRCMYSPRPPSHTCCSKCKKGWFGKKEFKCWTCPIGRGCNYTGCGCF